ncbi:MAG: quinone-dependent dihydroorotate dehydrogenase [Candidatus Hydrogenedentota bacterium]
MGIYHHVIRPLAFWSDAEAMHDRAVRTGSRVGGYPRLMRWLTSRYSVNDARLRCSVAGLECPNPIGLAAGYDKSGYSVAALATLGFGFIEVGSVSADPSDGNPRPRLWRVPADDAIVVNYGLPNEGADAVAPRLSTVQLPVPLGVNVVKTNRLQTEPDEAVFSDYEAGVRGVKDVCDYLMINLSCPNTESGRDFFGEPGQIAEVMRRLDALELTIPVFFKISPMGGDEALDRLLEEADPFPWVSGFMFNLPPGKPVKLSLPPERLEAMPGAVAGKPIQGIIDERTAALYRRMDKQRYRLIAAGGVFNAEDAYHKIRLGASLAQLFTGLVYEGPGVVRRINKGLLDIIERDGLRHIHDALGADAAEHTV